HRATRRGAARALRMSRHFWRPYPYRATLYLDELISFASGGVNALAHMDRVLCRSHLGDDPGAGAADARLGAARNGNAAAFSGAVAIRHEQPARQRKARGRLFETPA